MKTFIKTAIVASAFAAVALPAAASADTYVFNVAGAQSFGELGDALNDVFTVNIGANSRITDVAYNVSLTAFSPSWLSEATLGFTSSDLSEGVFLNPGFADNFSGTASYADSASLTDLGLDFTVGADGILRLEFFEDFDDGSVAPDGVWNSGSITFTYTPSGAGAVPEPATWAMMIGGFGMVGGAMRRRQKVSVRYA
jgi:hypothetical protein